MSDMDAFGGSEYSYWWGPLAAMRSWQEERIRRRFGDPSTQLFKVVDDANDAVVAWAKWEPPSRMVGLREGFVLYDDAGRPTSAGTAGKNGGGDQNGEADGKTETYAPGPPEGSNIPLHQVFFDGIIGMEKKHQASEKLVLTHICTRHSYHGRGIASSLISSVLNVADKEGIPTYLEATRAGLSLYKSLGFKTIDTLEFDRSKAGLDTPAVLHIMVREPRAA
ncbi:hypothetical protein F4678DRAFT_149433 [Xylaria arbuscula]|nr:hypothetical protein F4678DRAFT_149433 [Xylaria arbuscula]